MKYLILLLMSPAYAHDFPSEQVEQHCATAMHYITKSQDECILEQYSYYDKAVQSEHYTGALWYGQHRNWRGEVVSMDFKPVLDRIKYLTTP